VVVHENEAMSIPESLSYAEAAAIPEAFLTAYDALTARGRIQQGESVLIPRRRERRRYRRHSTREDAWRHGAGDLALAGQASKSLATLGLDTGIDTSTRPFREQISRPVNVILDVLGGRGISRTTWTLLPRGDGWCCWLSAGPKVPDANLEMILRKRLEVIGTNMRSRGLEERSALIQEFGHRYLSLFGQHIPRRRADAEPGPPGEHRRHPSPDHSCGVSHGRHRGRARRPWSGTSRWAKSFWSGKGRPFPSAGGSDPWRSAAPRPVPRPPPTGRAGSRLRSAGPR
jgi:hypothetical protein